MAIPQFSNRVEGLQGVESALLAVANEYGAANARRAFAPAMRQAMQPVLQQINNNTPIDTGQLKQSVALKGGVTNRFDKAEVPGVVYAMRAGWFWPGGPSQYAKAWRVEFGSVRQPARMVLRNALRSNQQQVVDVFARELNISIRKLANRLRNRNLRS